MKIKQLNQKSNGIFSEYTILELASVLAGPAVGMFFAELGARVIKVENVRSKGDVTRQWKTEHEDPGSDISSYFSSVNWGKESIALDLRKKECVEIIRKLAQKADILITSFKAGDAEKLGLDYESIKSFNPAILYGEITGFGKNDPRVGYDAIIQGESGFTFLNGESDRPPVKMPVAFMDLMAAHQLKEGLLTAIIQKQQTGEGQYITTSLIQSGIASLANQATNWLVGGKIPQRQGSEHPNIVPYGTIFYTKDEKPLVLAIGSNRQFRDLCEILGAPDLAENKRFSSNQERVKNRQIVNERLSSLIEKWEINPLIQKLQNHNLPVGRVLNLKEVFEKPEAQELLLNNEGMKGLKTIAFHQNPDQKQSNLSTPPHLSANSDSILSRDLNLDKTEIEKLKSDNAIQ